MNSESDTIDKLSKSFNQYMREIINEESKKSKKITAIVEKSIKELTSVSREEFNSELMKIIWANKNIECAYVLDEDGIQITNTIRFCDKNEVHKNRIFYSADFGTDHSMERYYYPLISTGTNKYTTEPYVSLATGNLCITVSSTFRNNDGVKYIMCLDFHVSDNINDLDLINDLSDSDFSLNINGKSGSEISNMINKMSKGLITDSLTGAYNRRYIEERLIVDVFNSCNQKQPISVIMTDLDNFKSVNDTYGHLAGDIVLKEFGKIAQKSVRAGSDWVARYGGEEFLIVLINADENTAFSVAEKIRCAIENAHIQYNNAKIRITASFGTYTLHSPKVTYEQLIDHADKNLYMAKKTGKNKTVCHNNMNGIALWEKS